MTLENLLRIGKLKPHAASKLEIDRLLAAAERAATDASVEGLSSDARLDLAWRGIMQAAAAAMLASGYRPATSVPGHHQVVVQALPKTAGFAAERVLVLDAFRTARNRCDYLGVPVSDVVAQECAAAAAATLRDVRAWLAANHPELS